MTLDGVPRTHKKVCVFVRVIERTSFITKKKLLLHKIFYGFKIFLFSQPWTTTHWIILEICKGIVVVYDLQLWNSYRCRRTTIAKELLLQQCYNCEGVS